MPTGFDPLVRTSAPDAHPAHRELRDPVTFSSAKGLFVRLPVVLA